MGALLQCGVLAVRLSCYLRLPTGGNTTLWVSVDDQVRIEAFDLKDKVVLNRTVGIGSGQIVLPVGHICVTVYLDLWLGTDIYTVLRMHSVLLYVEHLHASFEDQQQLKLRLLFDISKLVNRCILTAG